ncbi:MAG: hypothetical protein J7642_23965 [Cyanobacteria bacterium SBC]|nr:hypothetical protein [Cyanobacteria bacterium SBC]
MAVNSSELRIMPLGDSLTRLWVRTSGLEYTARELLRTGFVPDLDNRHPDNPDAGSEYQFFVGTRDTKTFLDVDLSDPNFDPNESEFRHDTGFRSFYQGKGGYSIERVAGMQDSKWNNPWSWSDYEYDPNVILLMAGTNNFRYYKDSPDGRAVDPHPSDPNRNTPLDEIQNLIETKILPQTPSETQIFVASIPYINITNDGRNTTKNYKGIKNIDESGNSRVLSDGDRLALKTVIDEYNNGIEEIAGRHDRVHFVDLNDRLFGEGQFTLDDLSDGVHFDGFEAYDEMAKGWTEAIQNVFVREVTTLEDELNFNNDKLSLREALSVVPANGIVTFDPALFAGESTEIGKLMISLDLGELVVDRNVTVRGVGSERLVIDGNQQSRIFKIDNGDPNSKIDVTLDGLTIAGGNDVAGGGLFNQENLALQNVVIANSGGISSNRGTVEILDKLPGTPDEHTENKTPVLQTSIEGTNVADELIGTLDNDLVLAGAGDDIVNGGLGDDSIGGGAGFDRLYGDAGSDTFLLRNLPGFDVIYDFNTQKDFMELQNDWTLDRLWISDLTIRGINYTLILERNGDRLVALQGIQAAELRAEHFTIEN